MIKVFHRVTDGFTYILKKNFGGIEKKCSGCAAIFGKAGPGTKCPAKRAISKRPRTKTLGGRNDIGSKCLTSLLMIYFHFQTMAARSEIDVPAPMVVKPDSIKGNWKFFRAQWENYEIASGLNGKDPTIRVATLLSVMGEDCYEVYEGLPSGILSEDEKKTDVESILDALGIHFNRPNVVYERYLFNTSNQQKNELFDDYLCRLRKLSETCDFGIYTDEMIRDRIMMGTKDKLAKESILQQSELTLEKAIDICRTSERRTQSYIAAKGTTRTICMACAFADSDWATILLCSNRK